MRIQHNVMAMNAYRNYTSNVNAMKQNLEKLASGYKINRAGDDAAGLAISEKMRAQITGLETAQKNAKDGISLVQTAEGALTEVHDMLNRMVELATQSANGTYDNDTDRFQLQKEMDQLRSEIDRIADSSNFNGIQLLDGSMDAGGDVTYTTGTFEVDEAHATQTPGAIQLPEKGPVLGTNTVVHSDAVTGGDKNVFSVDLHNLTLAEGGKVKITIGAEEFTMADEADAEMSASDIAKAFVAGDFAVAGATWDAEAVTIGGSTYKVSASGTRLTFEQVTDDGDAIPQNVKVEEVAAAAGGAGGGATATAATAVSGTITAVTNNGDALTIGGVSATIVDATNGLETQLNAWITAWDADTTVNNGEWTAALNDTKDGIILTNKTEGALDPVPTLAGFTVTNGTDAGDPAAVAGDKLTGDYNVETTVIETKQANAAERLASTKFDLTDEMTSEGSQLTIGRDTYTFTTDKSKIGKDGYVVYNEGDSLDKKAQLLTKAAENNKTYTVGHTGTGGNISITEVVGQTNFDLTTVGGIEKSLGFKTATTNPVDDSKGLTLQIGDTAESYNQLKVNIKDCHTKALGIADISIANQDGAQEAISKIKAAINQVSDVRGTLGATQNRLDHTMNNLSVMTENIQDAESTIRDVDIAEEMMAYTKNNILIQSAQAMLAQANQVPQGVLQLLQ